MRITQAQHAILVSRLVRIQEELAVINDILLPADDEDAECKHLNVEHEETMDDEKTPYKCLDCGAVSEIPFNSGG